MNYILKLFLCTVLCTCVVVKAQILKKDTFKSVPQLITANGYPAEKHRVKTEDGYILQLHRIPAGRRTARRSGTGGKGKKAVLFVHGLLGSSGDFVIMGPGRSISYMLADAGYDVWLGNLRGTQYSAHQNLTRADPKFWEYSFHEHGIYDVPALIDKVLNVTNLEKILVVGYSMGTTSFFITCAEKPEYNDKVVAFVALAPSIYLDNIKPMAEFGLKTMDIMKTLRSRGINSLTAPREVIDLVIGSMCNVRRPQQDVCMRLLFSIVGEDYEQNDWDMTPMILARFQPASLRQLEHYGKIGITGVFTAWEDGLWGRIRPYNLTNVQVPVSLIYGENDQLTEKSRVLRLAAELEENGVLQEVRPACSWPKFNHLDFVFARDVGKMFNEPLIEHITDLYNKYGST